MVKESERRWSIQFAFQFFFTKSLFHQNTSSSLISSRLIWQIVKQGKGRFQGKEDEQNEEKNFGFWLTLKSEEIMSGGPGGIRNIGV